MVTTFDKLCEKLAINPLSPSDKDLNELVRWCEKKVSTDCYFEGDFKQRFDAYRTLACQFLEKIQPNIQDDLTAAVPAFEGKTSLEVLVGKGFDSYLKKLKPTSKQINTKVNNFTLLQLACSRGNFHTTEVLISLGANRQENVTKGDPILFTALTFPIAHNEKMIQDKQSIYRLLSQNSRIGLHERNESGDTILHIMAVYGYSQLIEELLTHSEKLASIPNNFWHYPIHSAILNGQLACVKKLITVTGVNQLTDVEGRNALHYAAKYGNHAMVEVCLSAISKDSVDKQGQTALILASIANNVAAVQALIHAGAEVNSLDSSNRSALHYAVESNNTEIVKLLLAVPGIEVNSVDYDSQTPLDLTQSEGDEISELLIKQDAIHNKRLTQNV